MRLVRLAAALALVLIAAAVLIESLVVTASSSAGRDAPAAAALHIVELGAYSCLEQRFQQQTPANARIFLTPGSAVFTQRIAEFASGRNWIVTDVARAQYVLREVPPDARCGGPFGFSVTSP